MPQESTASVQCVLFFVQLSVNASALSFDVIEVHLLGLKLSTLQFRALEPPRQTLPVDKRNVCHATKKHTKRTHNRLYQMHSVVLLEVYERVCVCAWCATPFECLAMKHGKGKSASFSIFVQALPA